MEFKLANSRSLELRRGQVQDRFHFKIKEDIIPTVQEQVCKWLAGRALKEVEEHLHHADIA